MFTVTSHEIHWAIVVNHNLGINMAQNHIKKYNSSTIMTWTCLKKRSRVEIYAIMFDIVKYISFKNKIKKSKQLQNIWH